MRWHEVVRELLPPGCMYSVIVFEQVGNCLFHDGLQLNYVLGGRSAVWPVSFTVLFLDEIVRN